MFANTPEAYFRPEHPVLERKSNTCLGSSLLCGRNTCTDESNVNFGTSASPACVFAYHQDLTKPEECACFREHAAAVPFTLRMATAQYSFSWNAIAIAISYLSIDQDVRLPLFVSTTPNATEVLHFDTPIWLTAIKYSVYDVRPARASPFAAVLPVLLPARGIAVLFGVSFEALNSTFTLNLCQYVHVNALRFREEEPTRGE